MVSLVIKVGALVFIFFIPFQYAIQMQLLGGVWIIQTLPAVMLGLFTRFFNGWALLLGWIVGTALGTWMMAAMNFAPAYPLHIFGETIPCYTALSSLAVNLAVSIVVSLVLNAVASDRHKDMTVAADYI